MKRSTLLLALVAVSASLMTSCRKELCYDHDLHAQKSHIDIHTSWEQEWERPYGFDWKNNWNSSFEYTYDALRPAISKGIRVNAYQGDAKRSTNIKAEGQRVVIFSGKQQLLFFNNDTEYILIDGEDAAASASATTRTRTRASYFADHKNENTVNPPDMLYSAYYDGFEMIPQLKPLDFPVTMRPLTYTYWVRYEFESGLQYVALARGALSGMAKSVYLHNGATPADEATLLYDAELTAYGASARFMSFGVPGLTDGNYAPAADGDGKFNLNLEVRLKNGKMLSYDFDVTDQVKQQPRGGVITVTGIVVSDEDGTEGSGGFNPDVDGWGDYEDIEMPF